MTKILRVAIGAVILAFLFVAQVGQADEQPIFITYTGTVDDLPDDYNGDGIPANVIHGQSKGSFGPSMTSIVSEYVPYPPKFGTCPSEDDLYAIFMYSTAVVTFKNGDQLDASVDDGWLCVDMVTGIFEGETRGEFIGGTGRFTNATGEFVSSFTGKEFEIALLKPAAVERIDGVVEGTINLE
jgi:hypothetical protein